GGSWRRRGWFHAPRAGTRRSTVPPRETRPSERLRAASSRDMHASDTKKAPCSAISLATKTGAARRRLRSAAGRRPATADSAVASARAIATPRRTSAAPRRGRDASLSLVAHEVFRSDLGAVNDRAAADRGDAFGGAAAALWIGVRDEVFHHAVLRAADPNAALPPGMGQVQALGRLVRRLRIRHEQVVVGVDVDAARPAELIPTRQIFAVLVVDLDPVVVAIADEEALLRVDGERVQARELARAAWAVARLAP